jgi:hypothetical protein
MRFNNGFRGLHDVLSGTSVVLKNPTRRRAPVVRRPPARPERLRQAVSKPVGVVDSVGPFRVRGAVRWDSDQKILLGEDSSLGRSVWIALRSKGAQAPSAARREVARPTRPRWLDGGEQAGGRWDAYVAPTGCSLADFVGLNGLPWHEARPLLVELADELAVSCDDGSLPPAASTEQVWVQHDGRVYFVDFLATGSSECGGEQSLVALNLLRDASRLILEGGRSGPRDHARGLHAPIPLHARAVLDRLFDPQYPGCDVREFHDALNALAHETEEIAPGQRLVEVGVWGLFHLVPIVFLFGVLTALQLESSLRHNFSPGAIDFARLSALWSIPSLAALWLLWSIVTRGGLSLRLTGLALVAEDGRRASRLRCGLRTLLVWAVPLSLAALGTLFPPSIDPGPTAPLLCYGLGLGLLGLYVPLALLYPSRGIHDWLSGTHIVPR